MSKRQEGCEKPKKLEFLEIDNRLTSTEFEELKKICWNAIDVMCGLRGNAKDLCKYVIMQTLDKQRFFSFIGPPYDDDWGFYEGFLGYDYKVEKAKKHLRKNYWIIEKSKNGIVYTSLNILKILVIDARLTKDLDLSASYHKKTREYHRKLMRIQYESF